MKKSKPKKKKVKKGLTIKQILKKKKEFDKRWGKVNEEKLFDLIEGNLTT